MLLVISSCQNNTGKSNASAPASAPSAPATQSATAAKLDDALLATPLGQRLKADFNPNPVSQAAIDQNIIIQYALKNNLDVKRTSSGLYYVVEKEGAGAAPLAQDIVTINYRGYLLDGTEFDSSYKKGQPLTYSVSGFVPGWIEALQLMKPGEKIKLIVPSALAYGQMGTPGGPIGPNAVLGFDMELLKVGK
jgi:FKBP-type peptidyl-prolyl cis-trans isomerase